MKRIERNFTIVKKGKEIEVTAYVNGRYVPTIDATVTIGDVTAKAFVNQFRNPENGKTYWGCRLLEEDPNSKKIKELLGLNTDRPLIITHEKFGEVYNELKVEFKRLEAKEKIEKICNQYGVDSIEFTPIKQRYSGEESEFYCDIIVEVAGKTYEFRARNIFDFGLVINPKYIENGGLPMLQVEKPYWDRYQLEPIPMTEDEVKAVNAAYDVAYILGLGGIRM